MARNTVAVDHLAETVMKGLTEYADASTELVKQSVQQVSQQGSKKGNIGKCAKEDWYL